MGSGSWSRHQPLVVFRTNMALSHTSCMAWGLGPDQGNDCEPKPTNMGLPNRGSGKVQMRSICGIGMRGPWQAWWSWVPSILECQANWLLSDGRLRRGSPHSAAQHRTLAISITIQFIKADRTGFNLCFFPKRPRLAHSFVISYHLHLN